ncbi:carboxypeptidase-like regulatory domain-containing protein [Adhaeribacter radiodurans]|uniref:Carboxypeptidase-like regulatory domain-containing protein n=1 Tax=Adhaeribacter radiodurans TaxID=2745197 RepID=A0A7L7L3F5_9BACT|nr:carboxypeptidase-like regulatory domain-containing protein [Adhaeribacter radiodurans]QMU27313.1 carboxypeptidase-like regulatory domain-containing protein [Adhaeribacter radiodurans]
MQRSFFIFLLFLISGSFFIGRAQAQQSTNIQINGSVIAASTKKPLANITVISKRLWRGTITNELGQFRITTLPGDTLYFRSVGYKTKMYPVTSSTPDETSITINLEEGNVMLEEIEVTIGPDYEKVNRYLRNQKKKPEPRAVVKPAPPKPVYEEKVFTPPPASVANPISFIYDQLSKEGRDRRKLQAILDEQAAVEKVKREQAAQQKYDSLFLDRNKNFRRRE